MASLKKKAVNSVIFLGIRRIIVQVILTGSNIILARLLFPNVFGAFAIVMGIINLMAIFSSLGLGAAILQKKEEPQPDEMQAVFTFNLLLSSSVTGLIIVMAPLFFRFYQTQLGEQGVFYLRLLSFAVIGFVLKEISSFLLERRLEYGRLAIAEIIETLILQGSTMILAFKGFGVLSFIWGVLLSRFLAFVIFFLLAPWPMALRFSLQPIRKLLPFGINFQLNTIIGGLNLAVIPIFVGKVSGASAVGFLNWASGLAAFPRAIIDILGRLTFPVCARVQDDKRLLRLIIEKTIEFSCLASFPLIIGLIALARPTTTIIYTSKWLPGIPALYFFSLQSIFVVISAVLVQTLLALGEAKTVRSISLFWAILQWVLTVPLVFKFGFTGLAVAGALGSATFFIPLYFLRKRVEFEIGSHVWPYLLYSFIGGGVAFIVNQHFPAKHLLDLVVIAGTGGLAYLILIFIFKRKEIVEDILKIKRIIFSKSG